MREKRKCSFIGQIEGKRQLGAAINSRIKMDPKK
jgi:hypothetical protein